MWGLGGRPHKPDRLKPSTRFVKVVHLVRHPLQVILSRWNLGNIANFNDVHRCNVDAEGVNGTLALTVHHWVHWNLFIESYATIRLRIEDFDSDRTTGLLAHSICADFSHPNFNLTCPDPLAFVHAAAEVSTTDHSEHTQKLDSALDWRILSELNHDAVALAQFMAIRYGYDVPADLRVVDPSTHRPSCFLNSNNKGRWTCSLVPIQQPHAGLLDESSPLEKDAAALGNAPRPQDFSTFSGVVQENSAPWSPPVAPQPDPNL